VKERKEERKKGRRGEGEKGRKGEREKGEGEKKRSRDVVTRTKFYIMNEICQPES
jgi:hypothetical protein